MTTKRFAVNEMVVVLEWYGGQVVSDDGGEFVVVITERQPMPEKIIRQNVRAMTLLEKNLWRAHGG